MSQTINPESGQGGMVSFGGNAFAVTTWKLKRTYKNANTTVTDSNSAEEYYQICQGWTCDIEVPIDTNNITESDFNDFDPSSLQGGLNNAPIDVLLTRGGGTSYSGHGWCEATERTNPAEDVGRYTMTIRGTGALTNG